MSEKNLNRVEVVRDPAPDTSTGRYRRQESKDVELWIQLTPLELDERKTEISSMGAGLVEQLAAAQDDKVRADRELKRLSGLVGDKRNTIRNLKLEVAEERANVKRTVDVFHHYPANGTPREILVINGELVGSGRKLEDHEIDPQTEMAMPEPTPANLEVVHAAAQSALAAMNELDDAKVSPKALQKYVILKVPGMDVEDSTLVAVCAQVLVDAEIRHILIEGDLRGQQLGATEIIDRVQSALDWSVRETVRLRIEELIRTGVLVVPDEGFPRVEIAAGDESADTASENEPDEKREGYRDAPGVPGVIEKHIREFLAAKDLSMKSLMHRFKPLGIDRARVSLVLDVMQDTGDIVLSTGKTPKYALVAE